MKFWIPVTLVLASCSDIPNIKNNTDSQAISIEVKEPMNYPIAAGPTDDVPEVIEAVIPIAPPLVMGGLTKKIGKRTGNSDSKKCDCQCGCDLGTATFSGGPNDWYEVETQGYPVMTPLSMNRNSGYDQGDVELTIDGLKILRKGTYFASITAIVQFQDPNRSYSPLLTVFLVPNGVFDPMNITTQIGAVGTALQNVITNISGSGILLDVPAQTSYSLVVANGGSPQPEPITIVSWSITVYKICGNK